MFTHHPNGQKSIHEELCEMRRLADELWRPVIMNIRGIKVALNPGGDVSVAHAYVAEAIKRRGQTPQLVEPASSAQSESFASFTIRDEAAWEGTLAQHEDDGEGYPTDGSVFDDPILITASSWAHLMEQELNVGGTLDGCAEHCLNTVNARLGRNRRSLHVVVEILSRVWVHGEALKQWYVAQKK